jgi:HD superfamily phosphodiesterase
MNKSQIETIKIISKDAISLDWKVAFKGKAYGNRHLFRVAKIIKFMVKKEGGDLFIAQTGGWIHDVSLAWGSDYDPILVEKRTRRFLRKYHVLTNEELNKIVECATLHETASKSSNLEAKIVHDADVIDKCGSLGVIRHIWKMTNMLEGGMLNNASDLKKLETHLKQRKASLYTKTAVKIAKNLNRGNVLFFKNKKVAFELMKIISSLAWKGKTSDVIAKTIIIKNNTSNFSKLLKQQLSCSYLKNL